MCFVVLARARITDLRCHCSGSWPSRPCCCADDRSDELGEGPSGVGHGSVVVDVAGISFIDSTGAAPLLDARRSWPDAVQLRGDNPPLNRLLTALELTRTDPAVESTAGPPETRAGR